jgi:hypothetical protein
MVALRSPLLAGLMASLAACAHSPSPRAQSPRAPSPQAPTRIKLAVLPVESDQFPKVADSVNDALREVRMDGIDDYFLSKVTLEVAQLSIECVEQSNECYSLVGKSMAANKILMASVLGGGKHRHERVRLIITLFDVDTGQAQNVVEQLFKNAELASSGAAEMVQRAISTHGGGAATAAIEAKGGTQ